MNNDTDNDTNNDTNNDATVPRTLKARLEQMKTAILGGDRSTLAVLDGYYSSKAAEWAIVVSLTATSAYERTATVHLAFAMHMRDCASLAGGHDKTPCVDAFSLAVTAAERLAEIASLETPSYGYGDGYGEGYGSGSGAGSGYGDGYGGGEPESGD